MSIQTCKHFGIDYVRTGNAPIPHDRCERCHEEIKWKEGEERMEAIGSNGPTGDHYADPVNHPDHYQSEAGVECIDAIRAALGLEGFVAHCRGTAIKYAWRSGKKQKHAEDLRKAAWYLTRAAEVMEGDA